MIDGCCADKGDAIPFLVLQLIVSRVAFMSVIAVAMNGTPSTDSATEVSTRTNQAMLSLAATLATNTKWKNTRNYWDLPAFLCSRLAKQHIGQQDVKLARSDGKDGVNVYLRKGLHKSFFRPCVPQPLPQGGQNL